MLLYKVTAVSIIITFILKFYSTLYTKTLNLSDALRWKRDDFTKFELIFFFLYGLFYSIIAPVLSVISILYFIFGR